MKKIAFATCAKYPELPADDRAVISVLASRGIEVEATIWNSKTDWSLYEAVVLRATWDYFLHYADFLNWLKLLDDLGIRCLNSTQVVRWNLNKTYLNEFERKGIPIIPTRWLAAGADLVGEVKASGWDEVILKPSVSADGHRTFKFRAKDAIQYQKIPNECVASSSMMLQPYLPGIQNGERSLIFFNRKFSHAVLKSARLGGFLVQTSHGGTTRPFEPHAADLALAEAVLKEVPGDLLYARVDLIEDSRKTYLGELELAEPSLYFLSHEDAPRRFADAINLLL